LNPVPHESAAPTEMRILFQLNDEEQLEVDEYLRGRFKVKDEEDAPRGSLFDNVPRGQ
jgi:hypothetical protein